MEGIIFSNVNMCGIEKNVGLCDINVVGSRPALASKYIRYVLLVINPNKLDPLSWLLIYLCNK